MPFLRLHVRLRNSSTTAGFSTRTKRWRPNRPNIYITIEFEVCDGPRCYKFPAQPFRLIRELTRAEVLAVLPNAAGGLGTKMYYYEIHTD